MILVWFTDLKFLQEPAANVIGTSNPPHETSGEPTMTDATASKRGHEILSDPLLNKGAAFSEADRRKYGPAGAFVAAGRNHR